MISGKRIIRRMMVPARPVTVWAETQLRRVNQPTQSRPMRPHPLSFGDIHKIRQATLEYVSSMKVSRNGEFLGYRYSGSTTEPILYCTLAALLIKHLYRAEDDSIDLELERVLQYQGEDGLFRDPVIACPEAQVEDWWGWRHLTLHALMTLSLYGVPPTKELHYLKRFSDKDRFRNHIASRDWGARAGFTSNELHNIGVMLQYARDYQNSSNADSLLEILYEALETQQDPVTGLYGDFFDTPERLSSGVQAGYHFWLLLFYERRPIQRMHAVIDSALRTQSMLGGFGVNWNSSACEDIDSIDPLVRLSRLTDYRIDDVKASLWRALPAILQNLNDDGGWTFRRHEALHLHPQMSHAANESNVFYSWFRTLGLAYCLLGLGEECPKSLRYDWKIPARAPGHQFF
jgi:hypothetical protein